jgi:hypothetical protein
VDIDTDGEAPLDAVLEDDSLSFSTLLFNPSVTLTVFKASGILDPVVIRSTSVTGPLTAVSLAVSSRGEAITGAAVAIFLNFLCRYLLLLRSEMAEVVSVDLEVFEDEWLSSV